MKINYKYNVPFEPVFDFAFAKYNELVDCTPYEQHIIPEIPRVISLLKQDKNTRQAIIVVSEGIRTNDNMNSCLISVQWQIVDKTLVCTANYRSQCQIFGQPNDEKMLKYLTTLVKGESPDKDSKLRYYHCYGYIDDVLIEVNVANYHRREDYLIQMTGLLL